MMGTTTFTMQGSEIAEATALTSKVSCCPLLSDPSRAFSE